MRRGRPGRSPLAWWSRRRRWFKLTVLASVLAVVVGLAGVSVIVYRAVNIPTPADIAQPQQISLTYADGSALGTIGSVDRVSVPLAQVPLDVRRAVLAAEDRSFYSEPGISVRGIGRALVADVTAGGISQGGSTITQQYVKNAYLTQKRTFTRKIAEIALAIKISHRFSKDQVLEDYLNTIYFGRGAYGIQAASRAYFGVDVGRLTVGQAAVIAGLIRAPSVLDPAVSPQAAKVRWGEVLDTMVGQRWLTVQQRAATAYPTVLPASTRATATGPAGYVDAQVKAFLTQQLGAERVDLGGLTVTTTLDPTAQKAATAAVAAETVGAPAGLRVAVESVDPATGAIRAYYAGDDTTREPDAISSAAFAPGSSFKPIVLAEALAQGTPLSKTYDGSSPQSFAGTTVRNFGGEEYGTVDLVEALAQSINTVFVHLNLDTGPQKVIDLARQLGLRDTGVTAMSPNGTLALGQDFQYPSDMAAAYQVFADQGTKIAPYLVSKVVDAAGDVLYQASPSSTRVLPADVAADLTYAMEHVTESGGTAASAALAGGRPSAGKTGTVDGADAQGNLVANTAAWFDGFTPQLSTVVGLYLPNAGGSPQSIPAWSGCGCSQVTGGTVPAAIWKAFMDAALAGQPVEQLPSPTPVASGPAPTSSAPVTSSSRPPPTTAAPPPTSSAAPTTSAPPSSATSAPPTSTVPASPTGAPTSSATAAASDGAGPTARRARAP